MQDGCKSNRVDGRWWRANEYRVFPSDLGLLIAPRDGATIEEYDPWGSYREAERKSRSDRIMAPPYVDLMTLGSELLLARPDSDESHRKNLALGFVSQFGLLGLLPTHTVSIRCPVNQSMDAGGRKQLHRKAYTRQGGQWTEYVDWIITEGPSARDAKEITSGVTWFGQADLAYYDAPLDTIKRHLPGVDLAAGLPLPNTPEFLIRYAEPLFDIYFMATRFMDAVLVMSDRSKADTQHAERARRWLSFLSQAAAPAFEYTPQKCYLEERRRSAGLIASYALMVLWDLEAGRRAIICDVCGRFFVSDDKRAAYCSRSHRLTASSRRYRQKQEALRSGPRAPISN